MTEYLQTIEIVQSGDILPVGIRFIRGVYCFFVVGGLIAGLESAEGFLEVP